MIKLQEDMIARTLFTESKKLRVFDFDEVLAFTNSFVYVKQPNGKERKLTPGQFAVYKEKPGEEYDFRDFYSVKEPTELKRVTNILRRMIRKMSSGDGIFILTARPQAVDKHVAKYLKDIGINQKIPVIGLQSNNPKDKANWVEDKIDNEGYDDVYFADDSIKNVNSMKSMLRTKDVKFRVQHIKH